jgi:hypothetical protein
MIAPAPAAAEINTAGNPNAGSSHSARLAEIAAPGLKANFVCRSLPTGRLSAIA